VRSPQERVPLAPARRHDSRVSSTFMSRTSLAPSETEAAERMDTRSEQPLRVVRELLLSVPRQCESHYGIRGWIPQESAAGGRYHYILLAVASHIGSGDRMRRRIHLHRP